MTMAIGTPTYKLSKFFVSLLTPLALNEYTIKYLFFFRGRAFKL